MWKSKTGKVQVIGSIEELYSGKQIIENFDDDKIINAIIPIAKIII